MPIVVVGNANPLWEQMPSPPKNQTTLLDLNVGKTPETNTG